MNCAQSELAAPQLLSNPSVKHRVIRRAGAVQTARATVTTATGRANSGQIQAANTDQPEQGTKQIAIQQLEEPAGSMCFANAETLIPVGSQAHTTAITQAVASCNAVYAAAPCPNVLRKGHSKVKTPGVPLPKLIHNEPRGAWQYHEEVASNGEQNLKEGMKKIRFMKVGTTSRGKFANKKAPLILLQDCPPISSWNHAKAEHAHSELVMQGEDHQSSVERKWDLGWAGKVGSKRPIHGARKASWTSQTKRCAGRQRAVRYLTSLYLIGIWKVCMLVVCCMDSNKSTQASSASPLEVRPFLQAMNFRRLLKVDRTRKVKFRRFMWEDSKLKGWVWNNIT
jgi:hypothetical protein